MTQQQVQIGFLVYPGVIQLDVMAAYQVLSFPPNTQTHLIWKTLKPILSNEGLTLIDAFLEQTQETVTEMSLKN